MMNSKKRDIKNLGQVFTPTEYVLKVLSLRKNKGSILEPSCGNGSFSDLIKSEEGLVAIEIDERWCPDYALNKDFFDFYLECRENKITFNTIVGNPPFLRFKNVIPETKAKILKLFPKLNKKINLYALFIYCCIDLLDEHGEIIFINPYDFVYNTSCKDFNKILFERGTITDMQHLFDIKIFNGVSQNVCIWRYEKDNFTRKTKLNGIIHPFGNNEGILTFSDNKDKIRLGNIFHIKVGAVSGDDKIFEHENGNEEFVCSYTKKTNKLKRFYYDVKNDYLETKKNALLNRKIKKFNETNWWKWGRDCFNSDKSRIYVNCKTREKEPFFMHECLKYDGSILALFPKKQISKNTLSCLVNELNAIDWGKLGFKQGDRHIFSQRALENVYLPKSIFLKYNL